MQAGYQEAKHEYQRHFATTEYRSSSFPEAEKVAAEISTLSPIITAATGSTNTTTSATNIRSINTILGPKVASAQSYAKRKQTLDDPPIYHEEDKIQNRKKPDTKDTQWRSAGGIDYLTNFKDYQNRTGDSLAMDMIADVSVGRNESGSFSKWLKDQHGKDGLKEARFKHQASKAIEDMWPSWIEVTNRVFAKDVKTYRDVRRRAAAESNQEDVIVIYVEFGIREGVRFTHFGDLILASIVLFPRAHCPVSKQSGGN
ncbi:hypothetical protein BGZ95_011536 [Linnemannia exigua]|uniref:Uncharacterized protein n=1 Tax=Linnemannia exigua TaxID=604196 RepID=A0AAD4DJR7_9FUNG|nr:hypothetical protein BGZ95_011536 [Linnemannia exigua]